MAGPWTELGGAAAFRVFAVSLMMYAVVAARLSRGPQSEPVTETREDRGGA